MRRQMKMAGVAVMAVLRTWTLGPLLALAMPAAAMAAAAVPAAAVPAAMSLVSADQAGPPPVAAAAAVPAAMSLVPADQADHAGSAPVATTRANPDQALQGTLPVCSLAPGDNTRLAVEPCRPAPTRQTERRRAVPQIIAPMLEQGLAPGYTYHPAAPPVARPAPAPLPSPSSAPLPSLSPAPLNGCDAGGCRDAAGARYNGGVGNTVIGPDGKVCKRNGAWLQCF